MQDAPSKRCSSCKLVKPLTEFGPDRRARDGLQYACNPCRRMQRARWRLSNKEKAAAINRAWAEANPEAGRAKAMRYYLRLKAKIFGHYGECCACCGSTEKLTLDHVNGDGAAHRMELRGRSEGSGSTEPLYRWLITNGGKINGFDPRHEYTTEIYDSLCMVIYGLIED